MCGGDVTVSRRRNAVDCDSNAWQVLATSGDTRLGGEDFDRRLAAHVLRRHQSGGKRDDVEEGASTESDEWQHSLLQLDARSMRRLLREANRVKHALSSRMSATFDVPNLSSAPGGAALNLHVRVTRAKFVRLIAPLLRRAKLLVRQVLRDAQVKASSVSHVVLVGGSTRIPAVRTMLRRLFRKATVHARVNPDEAVAMGAAVQAGVIAGQFTRHARNTWEAEVGGEGTTATTPGDIVLVDVTPLSLGIETTGNNNHARGSPAVCPFACVS